VTRLLALSALFSAVCCAAIASAPQAITATVNGQSCPLLTRQFQTTPLHVDCASGFWTCDPGQTVYRASYELVVPATCANDRIMRGSFES